MRNETPNSGQAAPYTPSGKSPNWLAIGLISSSYFVVLLGVVAYCLVLP